MSTKQKPSIQALSILIRERLRQVQCRYRMGREFRILDTESENWLNEEGVSFSGDFGSMVNALSKYLGKSASFLPECDLVGRSEELQKIQDFIDKQQYWHIENPRGYTQHLLTGICGDAGTGKSALIRHMEKVLSSNEQVMVIKANSSQGGTFSGDLWLSVFENLLGIENAQGVTSDVISIILAETYNVSLEENDAVALSQFCSIRELSSDSEQFNSAVSVQIAFRNLFLHLAEASDLVFLLEDIHNADDFSLEILRFIIANSERIRPFVCVRRSSFTLSPVKVYTLLTGAKFTKSAMFFPLVS